MVFYTKWADTVVLSETVIMKGVHAKEVISGKVERCIAMICITIGTLEDLSTCVNVLDLSLHVANLFPVSLDQLLIII